jgi:hypothetical protein
MDVYVPYEVDGEWNRWLFPAALRLTNNKDIRNICGCCPVTPYHSLIADFIAERRADWLDRVDVVLEARDR